MSTRQADPAQGLRDSLFHRPIEPRNMAIIVVAIIVIVFVTDLLSQRINLAILYAFPMVACAHTGRRKMVRATAILAVVLTFAGYFFGVRSPDTPDIASLFYNFRMVNRLLCAMALLGVAITSYYYMNIHDRFAQHRLESNDPASDMALFDDVLSLLEQLTGGIVGGLVLVWVIIMDFLSPGELNLPILYVAPLMSFAWVRNRKLLWMVFLVLLFFTFAGYYWGLPSEAGTNNGYLLRNRLLASAVLLSCTMLIHFAMGSDRKQTTELVTSGSGIV
jgi:hypothetical protein